MAVLPFLVCVLARPCGALLEQAQPNAATLKRLALKVAHACRDILKCLWVPEIGSIQSQRPAAQ